ncbi:MAG: DNA polymerase III subunit alpha [Chitinophagaceae bacterium]
MYLQVHSYYSLRYGTLSIPQLVQLARENEIEALALTDINNCTGTLEWVKACREQGIRPLVGMEFRNGKDWLYTGIAKNSEGFAELNAFISRYHLERQPLPAEPPEFHHAFILFPFDKRPRQPLKDHEWVSISRQDLSRLSFLSDPAMLSRLVIQHPVTFADRKGYGLHQHLRAIDHNILLSRLESSQVAGSGEIMIPRKALLDQFAAFPRIIANTGNLIAQCDFSFDYLASKNRATFTGHRYDDRKLLEKLTEDGLEYRYGKKNREARGRVKKELEIIDRMNFSAYFLITWDIIRYSMGRGFYHVGRGSGANSMVAYCLKITDVDPIELDLYFERFLNASRNSPPDFDIDYSWKERDQVLEYIFKRYGHRHTALMGTMSTFRDSSIIRELGKVYGLPKSEIDQIVERGPAAHQSGEIIRKIFHYGSLLEDFPNLRSIHAGGVLITEKPIFYYSALDLPPKGFPTVQWDMYLAEGIGMEKLDILSQRGIGHIKEAAELVLRNQRIQVDVHDIPAFKTDPQVSSQLHSGDTIGCFYIESPAMRGLLKKLHCDDYLTLVAASSIIRPGVAKSGMMKQYIHHFHHPGQFSYLHPVMEELLKETYGVMVYQEDVIKISHHFGGLSLEEADVLRRIMSGKNRTGNKLEQIRDRFLANCTAKGYEETVSREVWRQIESFAGYSFSKAHSASYAVESFQSLYLKSHYPLEFMVGVINNFGGFYHTWVYVNEARVCGGVIQLPCINHSTYTTSIEGKNIYLGWIHLANLEASSGQLIQQEREQRGPFKSFPDFASRLSLPLEQLLLLIRIGAFRFTKKTKKALLWEAHLHACPSSRHHPAGPLLFEGQEKHYALPTLAHSDLEDAYDELELLGFPVTLTGFDLLQTPCTGSLLARDLLPHCGEKIQLVGNYVCAKFVRTVQGTTMCFGTFLDIQGQFFDTVHFPGTLKSYPLKGRGIYRLTGKVVEEFGFASMEIERAEKLPVQPDPRYG